MKNFEVQESYLQSQIQTNGNFPPIQDRNLFYQNERNHNKYLNRSFENSNNPSTQDQIALRNSNNIPQTVYYQNDPYFYDQSQHLKNAQQFLMEDEEDQLIEDQSQQQNKKQYQQQEQLNSQNDNVQLDFQSPFQNFIMSDENNQNVQEINPNESFQRQECHKDHQQTEQNYQLQNSLSLRQTINHSIQSSPLMNNQQDQQSSTNCEDQSFCQNSTSMQQQQPEVKERQNIHIEEEEQKYDESKSARKTPKNSSSRGKIEK